MFWISLLVLAKLKFQVLLNSDMFELRYRVSVGLSSARLGPAQVGSQIKLRDQLRLIKREGFKKRNLSDLGGGGGHRWPLVR